MFTTEIMEFVKALLIKIAILSQNISAKNVHHNGIFKVFLFGCMVGWFLFACLFLCITHVSVILFDTEHCNPLFLIPESE